MTEKSMKNITSLAGSPVLKLTSRLSAADLLTELAELKGFDPKSSSCHYTGSDVNRLFVQNALYHKYGAKVADEYVPAVNVLPRTEWLKKGYTLKEGETALCVIHTYRDGEVRPVPLYHILQMDHNP